MRLSYMVLASIVAVSGLSAKDIKRYTIKSGEIYYKVSGGGDIMGTKMRDSGTEKLIFKNYGALEITEENIDKTVGDKTTKKHSINKIENTTIYTVDFRQKQIMAMQNPLLAMYQGENIGKKATQMLEKNGGKMIGTDTVLGYKCNIWTLMGAKQCLYKNQVPLWLEVDMMGVKSKKIATKAKFNHHISDSKFALPKYPIVGDIGGESEDQISQEDIAMMQAMMQGGKEGEKAMASMIKKQRVQLSKMLGIIKNYRGCLNGASSSSSAKKCLDKAEVKMQRAGFSDGMGSSEKENLSDWSPQRKKEYINELDQSINDMSKAKVCMDSAKTMADLGNCMN